MSKVLIGTDFSDSSSLAVRVGMEWAAKWNEKPFLVHVDTLSPKLKKMPIHQVNSPEDVFDFEKWIKDSLGKKLDDQLESLKLDPNQTKVILKTGRVDEQVIEVAKNLDCSLLVVGGKHHDLMDRLFIGSSAEKLAQHSPVPVLVVKNENAIVPKKILLATDFSPLSSKALDWAIKVAKVFSSKIFLFHGISSNFAQYTLDFPFDTTSTKYISQVIQEQKEISLEKVKVYEQKLQENDISFETHVETVLDQNMADALITRSHEWNIDLSILAPHSKTPVQKFLLGSVAIKMLRKADHSLLLIH